MAQLQGTGITGSLEVINAYITGSITGSDAKFTSITGSLQGNATTATTSTTATTAQSVENEIIFNNSGTGDASGVTYDGTTDPTISYNTVGAPKTDGTNATGTWGISITGNAATVTDGVTTANISSYATTGVTAGTGLSGGGTVGTLTLDLDFSELTDKTTDIAGTTEFILQDGTTESRKAVSEIKLSFFNNDSGWTSNAGTVTSIATNNGITGGTITSAGTVGLTGQALALHNLSTNGLIARTGAGTVAGRTITQGTGITVSNGNGVSGNPTISLTNDSLTIGSTSVSLGGTATTLAGLTSVTSTDFVGDLTGNADTATTATNATNVATTFEASTNAARYLTFVDDYSSGNRSLKTDGGLSYNPSNNALTASYFVGDLVGSAGSSARWDSGVGMRLTNPDGASYFASSTSTGAIVIELPVSGFMARMTIKIVEYSNNESFEVMCGGYDSGTSWGSTSTFAYILGQPGVDRDFDIRFAHISGVPYIIIGQTSDSWSYLGVYVTEVEANGYSLDSLSSWSSGWSITQETDLSSYTINDTISGVQIGKAVSIATDSTTNNTGYIPMSLGTSNGSTSLTVDTGFHFNPGTNILTSPNFAGNLAWSYITGTPTTLSGYGITDGVGTGTNNTWTGQNTFNTYDLTVNGITIGRRNDSSNFIAGQYAGNASQT